MRSLFEMDAKPLQLSRSPLDVSLMNNYQDLKRILGVIAKSCGTQRNLDCVCTDVWSALVMCSIINEMLSSFWFCAMHPLYASAEYRLEAPKIPKGCKHFWVPLTWVITLRSRNSKGLGTHQLLWKCYVKGSGVLYVCQSVGLRAENTAFGYRVTVSAGFCIFTGGKKMLSHTCSYIIRSLSSHCLLKIPHGTGNLVQTSFIKWIWLNSLLTGAITKPLSTFPSCLFVSLDIFVCLFVP